MKRLSLPIFQRRGGTTPLNENLSSWAAQLLTMLLTGLKVLPERGSSRRIEFNPLGRISRKRWHTKPTSSTVSPVAAPSLQEGILESHTKRITSSQYCNTKLSKNLFPFVTPAPGSTAFQPCYLATLSPLLSGSNFRSHFGGIHNPFEDYKTTDSKAKLTKQFMECPAAKVSLGTLATIGTVQFCLFAKKDLEFSQFELKA